MSNKLLNLVVGIATLGRPQIMAAAVLLLARQTRLPNRLVISCVSPADIDRAAIDTCPVPVTIVIGKKGSSAQRNAILSEIADADIVAFFDDDFFAEPNYLRDLECLFRAERNIICVTGYLFADGAQGPGISIVRGLELIEANLAKKKKVEVVDFYGTYGCNMAFQMEPIRQNGVLFDEKLPLYGWQEDIDFAIRLAPFGRIVKAMHLRGVHLGAKSGRTSGLRFGYSQIANPIYLVHKGTMTWGHALKLMWRNVAANLVRSLRPEPWVDRKGRLKGNILALTDLMKGSISPDRILQLE